MKSRLSILRRTILFTLIMGVALLFLCTQYSFASEENDAGIILEKIGQSSSELPYRMIPDHSNKTYVIGDIRIKVSVSVLVCDVDFYGDDYMISFMSDYTDYEDDGPILLDASRMLHQKKL